MSEDDSKPRIEMFHDSSESPWPEAVKARLVWLSKIAHDHDFSLLCAIGLNHKTKTISAMFSPTTSENPHLLELVEDIRDMFALIAKRMKQ